MMPPRWNENRLTAKLGIDYPVVQGPLGGLPSQRAIAYAIEPPVEVEVDEMVIRPTVQDF